MIISRVKHEKARWSLSPHAVAMLYFPASAKILNSKVHTYESIRASASPRFLLHATTLLFLRHSSKSSHLVEVLYTSSALHFRKSVSSIHQYDQDKSRLPNLVILQSFKSVSRPIQRLLALRRPAAQVLLDQPSARLSMNQETGSSLTEAWMRRPLNPFIDSEKSICVRWQLSGK